jgi:hypothetical protein
VGSSSQRGGIHRTMPPPPIFQGQGHVVQPRADYYIPTHTDRVGTGFMSPIGGVKLSDVPLGTQHRSTHEGRGSTSFPIFNASQFRYA